MSDRNDIIKTPGKVILDATGTPASLYSSKGITAQLQETTVLIPNVRHGESRQAVTGRLVRIALEPTQWTAAVLAKLFTHGAIRKGGSILASSDKVLDLHTVDGQRRRVTNAFVQAEPAIRFLPGQTMLGEVVFYGIVPNGGNPNLLSSYWNRSNAAWSDADWNPEDEITPAFDISWKDPANPSAWDDIETKNQGLVVTPRSELTEDRSNRKGLINVTIKNYGVDATAEVLNIKEELVEAAAGFNVPIGGTKHSLGRDLVMRATSGNAFVTLFNAVLQPDYSFGYDAENTVVGSLSWKTDPKVVGGVKGSHMLVTTTDPEEEP